MLSARPSRSAHHTPFCRHSHATRTRDTWSWRCDRPPHVLMRRCRMLRCTYTTTTHTRLPIPIDPSPSLSASFDRIALTLCASHRRTPQLAPPLALSPSPLLNGCIGSCPLNKAVLCPLPLPLAPPFGNSAWNVHRASSRPPIPPPPPLMHLSGTLSRHTHGAARSRTGSRAAEQPKQQSSQSTADSTC